MLKVPYNFTTLLSNGKNKKHSAKQNKKENSQRELKEKINKGDKNSIICRFSLTYDGVSSR